MEKDTIGASQIQGWLMRIGPKIPLKDKPLFQLVWSTDERELRLGTFRRFDENGVFIKEETKVESCLKYPDMPNRWVLEQWFPPDVSFNEELPNSVTGCFEAIYVFENAQTQAPLPLNHEVVEFIVKHCMKHKDKNNEMLRRSISKENAEAKQEQSHKADLELLNDEGPLVSQFHDGTAILRP